MDTIYEKLVNFIPPAIIFAVMAYLVRFFGRAITDQKPFTDDREWEIELSGTYFLLNIILLPSVIGVSGAIHLGNMGTGHWWRFFIVAFCAGYLWIIAGLQGKRVYGINFSLLRTIAIGRTEEEKNENAEQFEKYFSKISRFVPIQLFSIVFAYSLTLEYQAGSFGWMILIGVEVFFSLVFMALIYSLIGIKLPQVDVFFNDGSSPIQNVTLLKINDDNVRIKENGQGVIINRNQIKKIEFFPSADMNPPKK